MLFAMPLMFLIIGSFVTFFFARISNKKSVVGSISSSFFIICSLLSFIPLVDAMSRYITVSYPVNILYYAAYLRFDYLSLFISVTALLLGLMVAIYSSRYMERDLSTDKYYALLLLMLASIVGISASADIFNIWVFFELMCVSSYILVSFRKESWEPLEAGFKYIIMSAAGSMFVLLGISIVFGQTGQLDFIRIREALALNNHSQALMGAVMLFIAGFGVKAAIAPFHTWLPDAHSEAPSGISAMLSGIVIEAGLFAMLRVLLSLYRVNVDIGLILIIMAVITMFTGNIMALVQTRIKRMLAYSSVAQMGYIVLGLGIGLHYINPEGFEGGYFHIITHAGMKGLAFLIAGIIIHYVGTSRIEEMRGLAKKLPVVAFCFAIAALGLAGVPPLSGFMSKWLIYKAGIVVGGAGYLLAAAAIFNSVLSLGYYLPVINMFYDATPSDKVINARKVPVAVMVPVVLLAASVILIGVYPDIALALVLPAVKNTFLILGGFR